LHVAEAPERPFHPALVALHDASEDFKIEAKPEYGGVIEDLALRRPELGNPG
jgi:hypothetical protein